MTFFNKIKYTIIFYETLELGRHLYQCVTTILEKNYHCKLKFTYTKIFQKVGQNEIER